MKLSLIVALSVAEAAFRAPKGLDANGNQIKGKHPYRKLQSINKFYCNYLEDNEESEPRKGANDRLCGRVTRLIEQLSETFKRETCSFYDPSVRNGGPNPDESVRGLNRFDKPRRVRRELEEEAESEEDLEDCGPEDAEDPMCQDIKRRLTPEQRRWRRFNFAIKKWCIRYTAECHGERVHKTCTTKAQKWFQNFGPNAE